MTKLQEDKSGYIELSSGNYLDVMDPDPGSITLNDVAHALSLNCRFNGHCDSLWTVASHALFVSRRLQDQGENYEIQLAGLHHDDGEFAVSDIPRPVKPFITNFNQIEERVLQAVLLSLGLEGLPVHDPIVKSADNWALMQEAGELMPSRGENWGNYDYAWDGTERGLGGEVPEQVRTRWLRRHRYLVGKLHD